VEDFSREHIRTVLSLIICILLSYALINASYSAFSQELEERLHTDWAIMNYEVIPPMPLAGERSRLQVSVGIAAIIEPLPQTVEVALKIDGVQKGAYALTFEGDPAQVLTIEVDWAAVAGKHIFEWIIDPLSKYDDPDLENNYVAFDLEIAPAAETESVATTVVVTETITTTQIEEVTVSEKCPEHPEMGLITETVTRGETTIMILETARTETLTETSHHPFTVTEKVTETMTTPVKEVEKYVDYLLLGVFGGASALVAGILGLMLGRRLFKKTELPPLGKSEKLPEMAIFSSTIYRLARKLDEGEWEAKPGEYIPETGGIITVDKEGNVAIVSDYQCLYSSEINKRPLAREDLEKMDRRVLENLLDQLKSTRETTEAMELELNDKQRQAIEEVIRRMEEELSRRKLIQ